jgi:hypothetical protein
MWAKLKSSEAASRVVGGNQVEVGSIVSAFASKKGKLRKAKAVAVYQ